MVIGAFLATLSSGLYFYMTYILWNRFNSNTPGQKPWPRNRFLIYVTLAATLQLFSFAGTLVYNDVILFNLGTSLSLITWTAVFALLITNIKNPTENLGIFIFPLAGLSTLLIFYQEPVKGIPLEIGIHVILSVGAYSILGLAAAQASLYAIQEKRFQQKKLTTIFKNLPPLQVMESMMLQLLNIGFVLLSLSLLTGFIFLEDMFAQHLVHKTFFALLAWLTYGIFLLGHYKKGWRGQTASRFTFWAYLMLITSYIGTEFVLTQLA